MTAREKADPLLRKLDDRPMLPRLQALDLLESALLESKREGMEEAADMIHESDYYREDSRTDAMLKIEEQIRRAAARLGKETEK